MRSKGRALSMIGGKSTSSEHGWFQRSIHFHFLTITRCVSAQFFSTQHTLGEAKPALVQEVDPSFNIYYSLVIFPGSRLGTALVCWGFYRRMSLTRWLINNRNWFFMVLGSPRSGLWHIWYLVRAGFPVH